VKNFRRDFERGVAGLLLVVISLFVFAQVISRYALHLSISYTEELAQHLFIWCMMFGAAAAAKRQGHLGLKLLSGSLGPRGRQVLRAFSMLVVSAFLILVVVSGLRIVRLQIETGQHSPGLGWPMGWVGLAFPVGAALILRRVLRAGWKGRDDEGGTDDD